MNRNGKFYEIESFKNNWNLRELSRQYDSPLFTRLSLSKDKDQVLALAEKGLIMEKPQDAIKDSNILEFIGDIGQMHMYVNYYDRKIKLEDESKIIGIILCQNKSEAVVESTLPENNQQIFANKYLTVLPSKETLIRLIGNK